jgi:polyhydroxybutyrate depolymerase
MSGYAALGLKTLLLAGMAVFITALPAAAEELSGSLEVNGRQRSYFAVIPETVDKKLRAMPAVIVLHGAFSNGRTIQKELGLDGQGAREGFVTIYPDGVGMGWNDGRKPNWRGNLETPPDDIGFLTELARRLSERGVIDSKRVYVAGVSTGGMMAFRLACDAPDLFAATAVVIAGMPADIVKDCNPGRAMPLLVMNGTNDPLMPYNGGGMGFDHLQGKVLSTPETMLFWANNNSCEAVPAVREIAGDSAGPQAARDKTKAFLEEWQQCTGAPLALVRLEGGGHRIPGPDRHWRPLLDTFLGKQNKALSASDMLWEFFRRFSR